MSSRNGHQEDYATKLLEIINMPTEPLIQDEEKVESATSHKPTSTALVETEPHWIQRSRKALTTIVRCIVIDKLDHWHDNALVDLRGIDTSSFSWGYYGMRLPVLVEDDKQPGVLKPFYLPDVAGESSNRLFKAANPDGFKATFKHKSSTLQKIQVGLMVALVLGLVFIMYILINQ